MKTTPEEYTTLQAKMAQWVRDATPEQKQEVTEVFQQAAGMAESLGKAVESIGGWLANTPAFRVVMSPTGAPLLEALSQHFEAITLLMETLDSLQSNPTITAAPLVSAFVERLRAELSETLNGFDILATVKAPEIIAKARTQGATKAANTRHGPRQEIRARILKACQEMPAKMSKNDKAARIAPDAFKWNEQAGNPFTWGVNGEVEGLLKARDYARGILKPSKSKN